MKIVSFFYGKMAKTLPKLIFVFFRGINLGYMSEYSIPNGKISISIFVIRRLLCNNRTTLVIPSMRNSPKNAVL